MVRFRFRSLEVAKTKLLECSDLPRKLSGRCMFSCGSGLEFRFSISQFCWIDLGFGLGSASVVPSQPCNGHGDLPCSLLNSSVLFL